MNNLQGLGGVTPNKEMVYKAILSNRNILEGEKTAVDKITKAIKALKLQGPSSTTVEKDLDQSISQVLASLESETFKALIMLDRKLIIMFYNVLFEIGKGASLVFLYWRL